ncbi:MAG TPA: hypothetical protein ENK60_01035 [Anaerolineae bacterium]|nr:hypothetical protein [Anaerolineae bacterium]
MKKHILLPVLILILIPFASQASPTSSRSQREAAVARAIAWIRGQFQAGEIRSMGHCDAAYVVALAGQNPDGPDWTMEGESLLRRCETTFRDLPRKDAGEGAKALRAALAAGLDPRNFGGIDLIAFLENEYNPDTGYYHPYNLFRNNLAIIALARAGRPIPAKAIDALAAMQRPDGCWGWPIDPDATASDTDTSGLALHALAAAGRPDHPTVGQCIARLRAMQNEDGGWELSGIYGDQVSNVDSTALVVQGLVATGWDPEGPLFTRDQNAVQAILSFQAEDGSFWWRHNQAGSLMLGTTQAIPPLLMTYPNEIAKPLRLYQPLILNQP